MSDLTSNQIPMETFTAIKFPVILFLLLISYEAIDRINDVFDMIRDGYPALLAIYYLFSSVILALILAVLVALFQPNDVRRIASALLSGFGATIPNELYIEYEENAKWKETLDKRLRETEETSKTLSESHAKLTSDLAALSCQNKEDSQKLQSVERAVQRNEIFTLTLEKRTTDLENFKKCLRTRQIHTDRQLVANEGKRKLLQQRPDKTQEVTLAGPSKGKAVEAFPNDRDIGTYSECNAHSGTDFTTNNSLKVQSADEMGKRKLSETPTCEKNVVFEKGLSDTPVRASCKNEKGKDSKRWSSSGGSYGYTSEDEAEWSDDSGFEPNDTFENLKKYRIRYINRNALESNTHRAGYLNGSNKESPNVDPKDCGDKIQAIAKEAVEEALIKEGLETVKIWKRQAQQYLSYEEQLTSAENERDTKISSAADTVALVLECPTSPKAECSASNAITDIRTIYNIPPTAEQDNVALNAVTEVTTVFNYSPPRTREKSLSPHITTPKRKPYGGTSSLIQGNEYTLANTTTLEAPQTFSEYWSAFLPQVEEEIALSSAFEEYQEELLKYKHLKAKNDFDKRITETREITTEAEPETMSLDGDQAHDEQPKSQYSAIIEVEQRVECNGPSTEFNLQESRVGQNMTPQETDRMDIDHPLTSTNTTIATPQEARPLFNKPLQPDQTTAGISQYASVTGGQGDDKLMNAMLDYIDRDLDESAVYTISNMLAERRANLGAVQNLETILETEENASISTSTGVNDNNTMNNINQAVSIGKNLERGLELVDSNDTSEVARSGEEDLEEIMALMAANDNTFPFSAENFDWSQPDDFDWERELESLAGDFFQGMGNQESQQHYTDREMSLYRPPDSETLEVADSLFSVMPGANIGNPSSVNIEASRSEKSNEGSETESDNLRRLEKRLGKQRVPLEIDYAAESQFTFTPADFAGRNMFDFNASSADAGSDSEEARPVGRGGRRLLGGGGIGRRNAVTRNNLMRK